MPRKSIKNTFVGLENRYKKYKKILSYISQRYLVCDEKQIDAEMVEKILNKLNLFQENPLRILKMYKEEGLIRQYPDQNKFFIIEEYARIYAKAHPIPILKNPIPYYSEGELVPTRKIWNILKNKKGIEAFPEQALAAFIDEEMIAPQFRNWTQDFKNFFLSSRVDFLICKDSQDYQPICAIEYDGKCHSKEEAKRRDKKKDDILSAAKLNLIRLNYTNIDTLCSQLDEVIHLNS